MLTEAEPAECGNCHGTGKTIGFACGPGVTHPVMEFCCSTCAGTGLLPADHGDRRAVGDRVRDLREQADLSLREAARLIPCSVTTISAAETGKMPPDHIEVIWVALKEAIRRRSAC